MSNAYVRQSGNDRNGGTSPSDAWLTISKALGAPSEQIINGDFSAGMTGWEAATGWSVVGGVCQYSPVGGIPSEPGFFALSGGSGYTASPPDILTLDGGNEDATITVTRYATILKSSGKKPAR